MGRKKEKLSRAAAVRVGVGVKTYGIECEPHPRNFGAERSKHRETRYELDHLCLTGYKHVNNDCIL